MIQQHLSNGSVVLTFEAFLSAPHAGETGTLIASVTDGSGPWSASKNITMSSTGENNATVQVRTPPRHSTFLPWPVIYRVLRVPPSRMVGNSD